MSTRVPALALCGLLAGCGPAAAPPPADQPVVKPASAEPKADATATVARADAPPSLLPTADTPRPAQEPPLTQEEIDLIEADPATLSPEMRRKRAFALRRKILQNPDSPAARQLEALRIAAEKGELKPQLPEKGDKGIILHARNPGPPAAPAPETAAPAPAPKKSP